MLWRTQSGSFIFFRVRCLDQRFLNLFFFSPTVFISTRGFSFNKDTVWLDFFSCFLIENIFKNVFSTGKYDNIVLMRVSLYLKNVLCSANAMDFKWNAIRTVLVRCHWWSIALFFYFCTSGTGTSIWWMKFRTRYIKDLGSLSYYISNLKSCCWIYQIVNQITF